MSERWAPIPSAPGYEASTEGRLRSVDRVLVDSLGRSKFHRGQIIKPVAHPSGYELVRTREKTWRLHRLILEAFTGPCPAGMEGCHNDGNPANNRLVNLRWDTISNNKLDTVRHGRHDRARRTHCPRNHPLDGPNLRAGHLKEGRRSCLACARAQARVHELRMKGVVAQFEELADAYFHELVNQTQPTHSYHPRGSAATGGVVTKTCATCGTPFSKPYKRTFQEFAKRRFCSRTCSLKGIHRPGRALGSHCLSGRHELAGDNLRVDGRGRRSCKACATEREAARRRTQRGVVKRAPRPAPRSKPQPQPNPAANGSVWRPAGWSPQPNIIRGAS